MANIKHLHYLCNHIYYFLVLFTFYYQVLSELFLNALVSTGLISYRKWANIPINLVGKTVVITGVDTGIGRATLEEIAAKGAKVIFTYFFDNTKLTLTSDIVKKHPHIKKSNLIAVQLDLASKKSIEECIQIINNCTTVIDVIINNAGVMCPSDEILQQNQLHSTKVEYQFQVNYLGHFYLTMLLLNKLKKSSDPRIVNLTSFTYLIGYPLFEQPQLHFRGVCVNKKLKAYSRSKLAILLNTQTLAKKCQNIKFFSVHPGGTISSIVRHIDWLHKWQLAAGAPFQLSPKMGAQTTLHCAFSLCKEVMEGSGLYFDNCQKVKQMFSHAVDGTDANRLWKLSLELCKLKEKDCF